MKHLSRAAPITVESYRKPDRWAHAARWVILAVVAVALAIAGRAYAADLNMLILKEPVYRYIDSETGCQYLSVYKSPLTPRIAADGRSHMGCKGSAR